MSVQAWQDLRRGQRADVHKQVGLAATLTRTAAGVNFAGLPERLAAGRPAVASTLPLQAGPAMSPGGAVPAYFPGVGLLPEGRRLSAPCTSSGSIWLTRSPRTELVASSYVPAERSAAATSLLSGAFPQVIEVAFGGFAPESRREVGRQLERELAGLSGARRGPTGCFACIDEAQLVQLIHLDYRVDIYRAR